MKIYLHDIFNKISKFSKQLDNRALLLNQRWVLLNELHERKEILIFRDNSVLIRSVNSDVIQQSWEYIDSKSLIISDNQRSTMYKQAFFDENFLVLVKDSQDIAQYFANETKLNIDLNNIELVEDTIRKKYKITPAFEYKTNNNSTHNNEVTIESSETGGKNDNDNDTFVYEVLMLLLIAIVIAILITGNILIAN